MEAYARRVHEDVLSEDTAVARLGQALARENTEEGGLSG